MIQRRRGEQSFRNLAHQARGAITCLTFTPATLPLAGCSLDQTRRRHQVLKNRIAVAGCVAAVCVFSTSLRAGVVGPGERWSGFSLERTLFPLPPADQWQGELLAERSESFDFVSDPFPTGEDTSFTRGTFASRVHRDLQTGGLAFVYVLDQTRSVGINDLDRLIIGSFESFDTDVYFTSRDIIVTRSSDGATLDFDLDIENLEVTVLVRSDATAFDANGSLFLEMQFPPSGPTRTETFAAFQPAADGGGPGPNPIPLPPAAWSALFALCGLGAFQGLRRRRAT
jgi:hypothetical protein